MEDGNLTVTAGVAAAANTLISGQPCTLIGIYVSLNTAALDPTVLPLVIEVVDEAATADIDANSKILQRWYLEDASQQGQMQRNLAIKAGKGICLKLSACGTNEILTGITWR